MTLPQRTSCLHVKAWHSDTGRPCTPSVGLCGCEGYQPPAPSPDGPGACVSPLVDHVDPDAPTPKYVVDVETRDGLL